MKHKYKYINFRDISLPNGVGKDSVELDKYTIYRDGTVINQSQTKPLRPDAHDTYHLHILNQYVLKISKKTLIECIFKKNTFYERLPNGVGKNSVIFHGYLITRQGIIRPIFENENTMERYYGRVIKTNNFGNVILRWEENGKKKQKSYNKALLIHNIFSGKDTPKKGYTVEFKNEDSNDCSFDNIIVHKLDSHKI